MPTNFRLGTLGERSPRKSAAKYEPRRLAPRALVQSSTLCPPPPAATVAAVRRKNAAFLAVVSVVAFASTSSGCKTRHDPAPPDKAIFGDLAPRPDLDAAPYLAVAHAIVTHTPRPETPIAARPGQRVVLTAWSPGHAPAVATGLGDTLLASVEAAATALATSAPPSPRLQLDVMTGAEATVLDGDLRSPLHELGLHGFVATQGREHVGAIAPTEFLAFKYFDLENVKNDTSRLAEARLRATLAPRAGLDLAALDHATVYSFTSASFVEGKKPGTIESVTRSLPPRAARATPEELVGSVLSGADYLARVLDGQGRYQYMVHPVDERIDRSYGTLRHAGSTYALLEAYGESHDPALLAKSELALAYLATRLTTTADGSFLAESSDEEQQKVGGGGLAMIAMAKHAELTGQSTNLEAMRSIGRFIVHQQYPDGHFRENADVERESPGSKHLKKEVSYYAGEAVLGLIRLYQRDPSSAWLDAAKKGADYLVEVRDAHEDLDHQIHDHWLSYALLDLYRETKKDAYAEHAFKIARAILKGEKRGDTAPAPDYLGAFYGQGETTPTSTRLEALAASLELSRFMGRDTAWIEGPAMELACFMRAEQLGDDNDYFLAHPEKMRGGVRESLLNSDVRIDYVQHAMSAWLRFARFLRDPAYGKTVPVALVVVPDAGARDAAK